MKKISSFIAETAQDYKGEVIAQELQAIANQYQNIVLSEQLESIASDLDQVTQSSYQDFVKAVNKPTRQNVMKYEKSIAPKKSK